MFAWITKRRTEGPHKADRSNPRDGDQFRLESATTNSEARTARASLAGLTQLVEYLPSKQKVARFESGIPLQLMRRRTQVGLRAQIATLLFVGSNPTVVSNV
jgi:hypothetical protein